MAAKSNNPGAWRQPFLDFLSEGLPIQWAARQCGISPGTAYYHQKRDPQFAAEWQARTAPGAAHDGAAPDTGAWPRHTGWRTPFLEALAETSNVTASAARAGVPLRTVYKTKRCDPAFAGKWLIALHEGYDMLEIELLGHLRNPHPRRKMDVGSALRLLAAHRATVERHRALEAEEDEEALLESIDRFIDDMRERRAANTAILKDRGSDGETSDGAQ